MRRSAFSSQKNRKHDTDGTDVTDLTDGKELVAFT
jgi:hypothetical protein